MSKGWVKGWNGGLTGPNTPSMRVTAGQCVDMEKYYKDHTAKFPNSYDYYIPIAKGSDTVAIAVGPDREETADFIVKADSLRNVLDCAEDMRAALQEVVYLMDNCALPSLPPTQVLSFIITRIEAVTKIAKEALSAKSKY